MLSPGVGGFVLMSSDVRMRGKVFALGVARMHTVLLLLASSYEHSLIVLNESYILYVSMCVVVLLASTTRVLLVLLPASIHV